MGKLRDQLLREVEEDNRNAARELIAADPSDRPGSGAFARACERSAADLAAKAVPRLIAAVRDGQSESENSRRALLREFVPLLGRSEVDRLILEYRR